jgi:SAM-dependent methyltransferase
MGSPTWTETQRRHYEQRAHRHLLPEEGGVYADNIVATLWDALGITGGHGIEIGCGAGRFTLPFLRRCRTLEAVDLSARQLAVLAAELDRRGIERERCPLHEANIETLDGVLPAAAHDFLTGVFILHHLQDPEATVSRLCRLVRPGGRVAFLEPNRWNPLFFLQIMCCPDMTWKEERGLYALGGRRLRRILEGAGLADCRLATAGFFPPQILNRFAVALRVEHRLERWRLLRPVLPFVVVSGSVPAGRG